MLKPVNGFSIFGWKPWSKTQVQEIGNPVDWTFDLYMAGKESRTCESIMAGDEKADFSRNGKGNVDEIKIKKGGAKYQFAALGLPPGAWRCEIHTFDNAGRKGHPWDTLADIHGCVEIDGYTIKGAKAVNCLAAESNDDD
ncbi:Uu.00g050840.m01.CDS01 [Anthostomella pinea]|uniref:Uu.00g050840.m01.CDS01 n=1 Tax=Anthostomella pinea TaxID=933095 RepID=A0AAI8YK98_9PEZI|nr:Uu.00g050840.m01.CDS01 [Anthostomella pinea]